MDASGSTVAGACAHCGVDLPSDTAVCPMCGLPAVSAGVAAPIDPARYATAPTVDTRTGPPVTAVPGPRLTAPAAPAGGRGQAWRPSRRALIALAAVVVVAVAGGAVLTVLRLTAPTPSSTVEDYFAALADGDADRALTLVADRAQYDTATYPLLTGAALADEADRPREVSVADEQPLGSDDGLAYRGVRVSYRAGSAAVTQTVVVVELDDRFQLQSPFVPVLVSGASGRPVSVNGVALGDRDVDTVAFPGAYSATAQGNALWAEATVTGVPQDAGYGDPAVTIAFEPPALAPDAEDAIRAEVRSALETCAASTQAAPRGCPFALYSFWSQPTSVKWTITVFPTVTVSAGGALFGGATAQITSERSGSVSYQATYTDVGGAERTESGDQEFQVQGTARADGSGIAVSLN
jgi:hypothetical protein